MIAKAKDDAGNVVKIACGTAVRANTDKIRRLNGTTVWRVVEIDSYNIILKSEKPDDERTLYFSAPTFLHYWKIVKEKVESQSKPLIGDLVVPKSVAVSRHWEKATFRVVGIDGDYVVLERESRKGNALTRGRPIEWLAQNFWVCFARAT